VNTLQGYSILRQKRREKEKQNGEKLQRKQEAKIGKEGEVLRLMVR